MFSMYAAKWLVAAGFAMLVAWLCLLSRSHGIHPIRRLLDLPGIRSKVGIALLFPFLISTIVHGSDKLRDLVNILFPSNQLDNASSRVELRAGGATNETSAIRVTAFTVLSNSVQIATAIDAAEIDVGDTLVVRHKDHSLTNDWVEGDFEYVPSNTTNFTFVVARTNGANAAFYQVSQGLRVVAPNLPYAIRANGSRLYVATTNQFAVSTTGGAQGSVEPGDVPPEDPLGDQPNHAYDPTNGVLTVESGGQFLLPNGDSILRLTPTVSFGEPHNYQGTTLRAVSSGLRSGEPDYVQESSYPLDSQCLWEAWHEGTNEVGWSCCSCEPKLDCGIDIAQYDCLAATCDVSNDTAYASLALNGTNIWTGCATHERWSESGGTSDYLSADPCGGCSACDSGSCDALDGPSVGSVRFRIALGIPDERHVTGFLWFEGDEPFTPTPQSFSLLARSDASVTDTTSCGVRTVTSSDRGGRTIVVSNITDGVRLAATFTASGANDRSWEITRSGNAMRFKKFSAGGNLMSDVSYAQADGVWGVVDNETGLVETTTTFSDPYCGEWKETVRSCGAVTASVVRVKSEIVGYGDNAVLRETERMERTSSGWLHSYATYHEDWESRRNGCLRMEWGDDRPWAWHDYDERGREIFRLEQRNGSEAPCDDGYCIEWLPDGTDAFATVLDYTPHSGDSCDTNDCDKVRTESCYVVSDGNAILIARTWTRFTRGVAANGWPTVTETTIRASDKDAGIDDPGNAVSVRTAYSSDSASVPYLLRGAVVSETDADGVTETHEYAIADGVVSETARKSYDAHPFPTVAYAERDLAYGNTLYESTRLAADESVEFDWRRMTYDSRNRLRCTEYSDGSSETNDYSCCQLRFRIDRTGAKTLFVPTNRIDRLYHAEEEVFMRELPHWGGLIPYAGIASSHALNYRHRCTQHFVDPFGRETNTVTRICGTEGESANPGFNLQPGWHSSETAAYPCGFDDVSVTVDARGLVTRSERFASSHCETTTNSVFVGSMNAPADKTTVTTSIRGGDSIAEEMSGGKWRRERTIRGYGPDGCAVVARVTESSDCGIVTNSVVHYDFLGRVAQTWTPLSCVVNEYEGASSRVDNSLDAVSGIATTNIVDDCGDVVGGVCLGVSSISRTDYEVVSGVCWRVETQATFADGATNSVHATRTRLTGLSDALRGEVEEHANGELVSHTTSAFSTNTIVLVETTESPIASTSVRKSKYGRVVEETESGSTFWHSFDPYGQVYYSERDGGSGRLHYKWYGFTNTGDVEEEDTFYSSAWSQHHAVFSGFDAFGNCVSTLDPMTNTTTRSYDADGRVVSEAGATYPLQKGYDTSGRMTSLRTTRDGNTWDETQWSYDAATGLCLAKTYADGTVVTNSYTQDGLLARKETVGGRWSERAYDSARRVSSISYSDGTSESFRYDVFGNVTSASNAVALHTYFRDARGLVTNETANTIGGQFAVNREYDEYGRLVSLDTGSGCGPDSFSYDACGRVGAMSNAEAMVVYAYTPDGLEAGYVVSLSNGVSFTRSVIRDAYRRGLAACITNGVSFPSDGSIAPDASYYGDLQDGGLTNVIAYAYDALSRPVSRNGQVFQYNARSEVIRDGAYGWQYGYDEIGNWTSYTANELNQYVGTAYDPLDGAVDEYSLDGEMLANGYFKYAYDAKSRLVSAGEWKYDYDDPALGGNDNPHWYFEIVVSNVYDHLDRRVQKITPEATHTFFYDGWMLVKEVVANTNGTIDVIEYHWGNDLSCSRGGAAGVGGLLYLSVSNSNSQPQLFIPWYDSNGNIMGYWDERGKVAASFDYGAFGETSTCGDNPNAFPIRFSTKYHDIESDLYYYTKRFYIPSLHRWLTRDPIEEDGGVNLYGFCKNAPCYLYDKNGLQWSIKREGGIFAMAMPTAAADSFISLASTLGLDYSDYKKWAHTVDTVPKKCNQYKVPNLVVYDHGWRRTRDRIPLHIINVWRSGSNSNSQLDQQSGYMVLVRDKVSPKQIESMLRTDGLYRYTFIGHGDGEAGINSYPDPFDAVSPVERFTRYGINRMVLRACGSAATDDYSEYNRKAGIVKYNNWEINVAKAGYFIGYEGAVTLLDELFQWKITKGANYGSID